MKINKGKGDASYSIEFVDVDERARNAVAAMFLLLLLFVLDGYYLIERNSN